jgi:hypothetical protein
VLPYAQNELHFVHPTLYKKLTPWVQSLPMQNKKEMEEKQRHSTNITSNGIQMYHFYVSIYQLKLIF